MERRIIVCVPPGHEAALVSGEYQSAGIFSVVCHNITDLMCLAAGGAAALLLVEEIINASFVSLLAGHVSAQPAWSDLPILLMTCAGAGSAAALLAVERLGNVTLLERPVGPMALLAATRSALRSRARQYQARDSEQRKEEFLATLAHELRNPLAPIRTSMAILQNIEPRSRAINQLRQVVDRQVTHLTRLVDDLLDLARITSGRVVLRKDYISLQAVINHAVEIASSVVTSKRHELVVQQPDTAFVLDADHTRLVQSVANLLVNAATFTAAGGNIVLRAEVAGKRVTFSVRDNGVGLEPASLTRIFELFEQTPAPGEMPAGLGIGLSLARQFAQLHGGTLHATSEGLGKGSEFILVLPVVVEGRGGDEVHEDHEDHQYHAEPTGARTMNEQTIDTSRQPAPVVKKVLVVDDNVDAADTLGALLGMDDFDVKVVYDGVAAVRQALAWLPDVVVMDIGMPGMDGYEAARLIKAQSAGRTLRLVALTGWGQATDRSRASEAGFDHHLVKPIDYDSLMKCLHQ